MINEENHHLCPSGKYYVPSDGAREEYIDFINEKIELSAGQLLSSEFR